MSSSSSSPRSEGSGSGSGSRVGHLQRTVREPRHAGLHRVTLTHIEQVNPDVRLLRLLPQEGPVKFLPGQWLDVHIPTLPQPGGFTITSTPSSPYLELAIQRTPNPPAAYLSRPIPDLLNTTLHVRVGGSFTWPPTHSSLQRAPLDLEAAGVRRVVFVAGGVGVNPLVSMLGAMVEAEWNGTVCMLYSSKEPREGSVLFLERLKELFAQRKREGKGEGYEAGLRLFLTGNGDGEKGVREEGCALVDSRAEALDGVYVQRRRICEQDLRDALGDHGADASLCYVCGVPAMTDEVVGLFKGLGVREENVLCEKWW